MVFGATYSVTGTDGTKLLFCSGVLSVRLSNIWVVLALKGNYCEKVVISNTLSGKVVLSVVMSFVSPLHVR